MATVVITGGTGLTGRALTDALLERGFEVIIFTRNPEIKLPERTGLSYAMWDPAKQVLNEAALNKADYIVNLAGASLAEKRWNRKRKEEIVTSRKDSASLIVKDLKKNTGKVKAVIQASATGWYGSSKGAYFFEETDPPAENFLGDTCGQWEAAIDPVTDLKIRLVKFRIGIVLSNEGGAIPEFRRPLKFGIAAILGSGSQAISWIHIDDMVRMILFALDNEKISGVYNAVAPEPVTNRQLVLKLAKKVRPGKFIPVHVPSFLIRLMVGEMSTELLSGRSVSADKILGAGFIFQYPSVETAIQKLAAS